MILLDTSALAKLVVEERESVALRTELATRTAAGTEYAISTIATVELRRLAIRLAIGTDRIEPVLRPFHVLRLTEGSLALAGRFASPPSWERSTPSTWRQRRLPRPTPSSPMTPVRRRLLLSRA